MKKNSKYSFKHLSLFIFNIQLKSQLLFKKKIKLWSLESISKKKILFIYVNTKKKLKGLIYQNTDGLF